MKKVYFIVPIVATIIFIFIVMSVKNEIKAKEDSKRLEEIQADKKRKATEADARQKAYEDAAIQTKKRIEEINARNVEVNRRKEEIQKYADAREIARKEKDDQYKIMMVLRENIQQAKDQLNKVEESTKVQRAQREYLDKTIGDVTQTRTTFEQAIMKLDNAEKMAASVAAAAQQGAKKN